MLNVLYNKWGLDDDPTIKHRMNQNHDISITD